LPWVKQLATGLVAKVQVADLEMVDINYPIQNKAKFQKSINKRTMAARRSSLRRAVRASNNYSSSFLVPRI